MNCLIPPEDGDARAATRSIRRAEWRKIASNRRELKQYGGGGTHSCVAGGGSSTPKDEGNTSPWPCTCPAVYVVSGKGCQRYAGSPDDVKRGSPEWISGKSCVRCVSPGGFPYSD